MVLLLLQLLLIKWSSASACTCGFVQLFSVCVCVCIVPDCFYNEVNGPLFDWVEHKDVYHWMPLTGFGSVTVRSVHAVLCTDKDFTPLTRMSCSHYLLFWLITTFTECFLQLLWGILLWKLDIRFPCVSIQEVDVVPTLFLKTAPSYKFSPECRSVLYTVLCTWLLPGC